MSPTDRDLHRVAGPMLIDIDDEPSGARFEMNDLDDGLRSIRDQPRAAFRSDKPPPPKQPVLFDRTRVRQDTGFDKNRGLVVCIDQRARRWRRLRSASGSDDGRSAQQAESEEEGIGFHGNSMSKSTGRSQPAASVEYRGLMRYTDS